jgi:hypothetical protein
MMQIDMKEVIPKKSLPRFQGDKRIWLDPVEFEIEELEDKYRVSFLSTRGKGRKTFSVMLPKTIDINTKFKCALVAYMCEGSNLEKGIYTDNSGNKGKNISFSNSDWWLIKLVVDEFQKLGITKDMWRSRLRLYAEHDDESEKRWWSEKLGIPINNFRIRERLEGDRKKASYAPHGGCVIELWSVIFSALIHNLINLFKQNKI